MDLRSNTNLATYQDVVDELLDLFGEDYDRRAKRMARRAAQEAYRSLTTRHDWTIYDGIDRVSTVAHYNTGTIAYDHEGGSSDRLVTLTDGTWPSWAKYGVLLISSRPYHVESRLSPTTITLTEALNPGADVAAETSYKIYRDTYPLPVNARKIGQLRDVVDGYKPRYVSPEDWLEVIRGFTSTSTPTHYTIVGEPENYSSLAVKFAPGPNTSIVYDFNYQRGLSQLRTLNDANGTVTTSGTAVTASTATFKDWHVGSVIRFGDTSNAPTGFGGEYPYQYQRIITAVTNTTTATIDSAISGDVEDVYYSLSDVLDIETDVMLDALLAEARARYATLLSRGRLSVDDDLRATARKLRQDADREYLLAKAKDDKSSAAQGVGTHLGDIPLGVAKRPFIVSESS